MSGHHGLPQKDAARCRRCDNCIHRSRSLGPLKCLHPDFNEHETCPRRQLPGDVEE